MADGRFKSFNRVLLSLGLAFMMMACNRPTSSTAHLQINLPTSLSPVGSLGRQTPSEKGDLQSMVIVGGATLNLMRVFVEISGGDMPLNTFRWYGFDGLSADAIDQGVISMVANQGKGRLVQVLAVYKESNPPRFHFFYGDKVADIVGEFPDPITVPVTKLVSDNVVGRLSGRYVINTGYPTGRIEIHYKPSNGNRSLFIDHSFMYEGWFSLFAMSDIPLEYRLKRATGDHILFAGPVSTNSPRLYTSNFLSTSGPPTGLPDSIFKFAVPISARSASETDTTKYDEARQSLIGWFGDGSTFATTSLSGKTVGLLNTSFLTSPSNNLFVPSSSNLSYYRTNTITAMPSTANLNLIPYPSIQNIGGAFDYTGDPFWDYIPLGLDNIEEGNDHVVPFLGPLRTVSLVNSTILELGSYNPANGDYGLISLQLLPNAFTAVDEVLIYIPDNQNLINTDRAFPCANPPLSSRQWVVPLTVSNETTPATIDLSSHPLSADFVSDRPKVGLCFKKLGYPMGEGLWTELEPLAL